MPLTLFSYFRSSASYRLRIALNLKGLAYEQVPIHLSRNGGEQREKTFLAINPQGLVPVLLDDGKYLSQSLAIIEYLDERYPEKPLIPASTFERFRARQLSQSIACEMSPLTNLRVQKFLAGQFGVSDAQRTVWSIHWTELGLDSLEADLARTSGDSKFSIGDQPSIVDCCLVPLMFNARRYGVDMAKYKRLLSIEQSCLALDAFQQAHPAVQPDAEP